MSNNPEKRIKQLPEEVIKRIKAGEVVQGPNNALKELLENAMDAGATTISVILEHAGLHLLQICDNGCGIHPDDFPLLALHHTTSKLSTFSDLFSIQTFGFRGEALASISHCSKMKVTSKQPQSQVGFEAYFKDGKMIDKATEKQIETPSKTAARDGTTISVENLFYNVPQRKQAYETTSSVKSEEQRIVKVVQLYALANAGKVGYSLTKKESSGSSSGLKNNENVFSVKKDENFQKRVCKFFGKDISQNLVEIEGENKGMYLNKFVMKFTNPNYSGQSMNFILFVNKRLVENKTIKKKIDDAFTTFLPAKKKPFVYLSLEIDPLQVDVNASPTKDKVIMRCEEEIADYLHTQAHNKLNEIGNNSRLLAVGGLMSSGSPQKTKNSTNLNPSASPSKNLYPKEIVREKPTDTRRGAIESYTTKNSEASSSNLSPAQKKRRISSETEKNSASATLSSVTTILQKFKAQSSAELEAFLNESVYVGYVDPEHCLLQQGTKLFLVKTVLICHQMLVQKIVKNLQLFPKICFGEPISVGGLVKQTFQFLVEEENKKSDVASLSGINLGETTTEEKIDARTQKILEKLSQNSELLEEFFSIQFEKNEDGTELFLKSLPELMPKYDPHVDRLPPLLIQLAENPDYEDEEKCIFEIAQILANFYRMRESWELEDFEDDEEMEEEEEEEEEKEVKSNQKSTKAIEAEKEILQNIIFPMILGKGIIVPKSYEENEFRVEIACLEQLFKVFERC